MKKGELIVVNKKEISIKNMGYILKQARLKMGYTRDQLSERVGISHRYLTAIENEERRPSYEVLSKLLRNLGLSADSIFYPEKESEPEEKQLLRLFQQCNERARKVIKSIIDMLLDNPYRKGEVVSDNFPISFRRLHMLLSCLPYVLVDFSSAEAFSPDCPFRMVLTPKTK